MANTLTKVSLGLVLGAIALGFAAKSSAPDSLLHPLFRAVLVSAIVCAFGVVTIAAGRASRAGRKGWLVANILIWPCAYVYVLAIDPKEP